MLTRAKVLRLVLLLMTTCSLHAETVTVKQSPLEADYIRSDYTVEQGLPDNVVNAIVQTDNGLLWIGTEAGLASFDGASFHQVKLTVEGKHSVGAVNALMRARNGDLWIGTDAGVIVLPKAEQDQVDPGALKILRTEHGATEDVEVLLQTHDGSVWVGTSHGLYRSSERTLVPVLQNVDVNRISEAADGHLLVIGDDGLVEVAGGQRIRASVTAAQLGVHPDQVFDVHQGSDGVVWFGTEAGIRRKLGPSITSMLPSSVGSTATNHLYEDSRGRLWVGTGVGLYQLRDNHLVPMDPTTLPRSIFVSEAGDLWLGSNGNGLVRYKPRAIRMYTKKDGLPNDQPMALLSGADGRLLVGSNCGFSIFDGHGFRKYVEKDGLVNSCVWTLAQDSQHNTWLGTYGGGLFKFRDNHFTQFSRQQGLGDSVVKKIVVAHDDSLWIATANGVSHMEGSRFRNYKRDDGLSSDHVIDVQEDRSHSVWVTTQEGLDRLVGDRFVQVSTAALAADQAPSRFVEDGARNLYVAGASFGLSRLVGNQLRPVLEELNINGMLETPDHQLWCTSRNGIYSFPANALLRKQQGPDVPLDYSWFNTNDGLLSSQTSVGSPNIVRSSDNKLWVATVRGLAMLDLQYWPRAARQPVIFLTGAVIDGVSTSIGTSLRIPPGSHRTEIHIAAVDLDTPDKVRLQYRLDGVDQGWQNANGLRMAVYTTIAPGMHQFLVRSTNSNGIWGAASFSYTIDQQAFLYERLWFRVAAAAFIILALACLYLVRVNALVDRAHLLLGERMQERERIARDLHDTFFQGIQGLLLRFNTGTAQLQQDEPARAIFEDALRQSDDVMLEGRELVLDLRGGTRETQDLSKAFAEVALSLRRTQEVSFRIISHGSAKVLHPIVFEEIYRIGKEALTNAFRHAKATEIEAELSFEGSAFGLRVRDNGTGLDEAVLKEGSRQGHWGLPGMRERAIKVGGRLNVWSRRRMGTEIELTIAAAIAYRHESGSRQKRLRECLRSAFRRLSS